MLQSCKRNRGRKTVTRERPTPTCSSRDLRRQCKTNLRLHSAHDWCSSVHFVGAAGEGVLHQELVRVVQKERLQGDRVLAKVTVY